MDGAAPRSSRDVALYLLIAFGGAWGLPGAAYLAGVRLTALTAIFIGVPVMFFPALAAFIVERKNGARVRESLGIRFRPNLWWLLAWLLPLGLALSILGVGSLLPQHDVTDVITSIFSHIPAGTPPDQIEKARAQLSMIPQWVFFLLMCVQGLVAGGTINAVAAFGEELGWRGFMQRQVAPLGFWKGSFLIGLIWGPWHWGLVVQGYNYPQHPIWGLLMMCVMTTLLSPLVALVRIRGNSVIAAAIFHGTFNGCAGLGSLMLVGGSDLTKGVTGLAGFIVLAAANLIVWASGISKAPTKSAG